MTETKNRLTRPSSTTGTSITRKNAWVGVCAQSPDEAHYKRLLNVHACSVHIVHDAADLHEPGLLGVVFDAGLHGWRRDVLFTMVATGVPVVVGPQTPRTAYQLVWAMKPGIEAAGGIFEIATDKSDFKCRLNAVVRAALLRSTQHEHFAQALLSYSTELPSALDAGWVPSSRHGMSQLWQAWRTYLEQHKRSDPVLTTLPGVKAAVHDLRNPGSGRLDGELIRTCFGLKRTELAKLLDVTPEALRQTPDSPKHREKFEVLEQIAALRTLLANSADFAKWLESPNTELESNAPISLIREGRAAVVADLVQDILTNRGD